MTISTRNLNNIIEIDILKKLCKSISTLDAIICREWQYRYYSYLNNWDENLGEECMEMRNGSGDYFFILFSKNGAIINGFAHESDMSNWEEVEIEQKGFLTKIFDKKETELRQNIWKGVIENVPNEFKDFILGEPVKSKGTTFCIWRKNDDENWKIGEIEFPNDEYGDGSADLLYILDNNPETYKDWALDYYDEHFENCELKLETIKHIYDFKTLTKEIILELNPFIEDFEELKEELKIIGYDNISF
jgi:hypothetical protein